MKQSIFARIYKLYRACWYRFFVMLAGNFSNAAAVVGYDIFPKIPLRLFGKRSASTLCDVFLDLNTILNSIESQSGVSAGSTPESAINLKLPDVTELNGEKSYYKVSVTRHSGELVDLDQLCDGTMEDFYLKLDAMFADMIIECIGTKAWATGNSELPIYTKKFKVNPDKKFIVEQRLID